MTSKEVASKEIAFMDSAGQKCAGNESKCRHIP